MNIGTVPAKSPSAVYRALGEGGVLLHLGSGSYHEVNRTGALLWELIDGARDVAEIASDAAARIDGVPEAFGEIVSAFLADLAGRELIALDPRA